MTNNRPQTNEKPGDDTQVLKAQTRLLRLYSERRQKGGWRRVADDLGISNVSYVFNFAVHGKLSGNPEVLAVLMRGKPISERKPMDQLEQKLFNMMRFHHIGQAHAIKKRDLLAALYGAEAARDESYNNPHDRKLRSMIETLNHDHGALICSSPSAGYFYASSLTEGLRAVEHLEKRARTQLDNTSHLKRNLQENFGGQLEMDV
jgi:hypothetical protein